MPPQPTQPAALKCSNFFNCAKPKAAFISQAFIFQPADGDGKVTGKHKSRQGWIPDALCVDGWTELAESPKKLGIHP